MLNLLYNFVLLDITTEEDSPDDLFYRCTMAGSEVTVKVRNLDIEPSVGLADLGLPSLVHTCVIKWPCHLSKREPL